MPAIAADNDNPFFVIAKNPDGMQSSSEIPLKTHDHIP
jgi:hypothetical protein